MRKLALLSLTCAFLLVCKKEQPPINPTTTPTGFNPKYKQIEPLILAFKQKDIIWVDVENSGLNTQSYPRPVFHYLNLVRYGVPVL